ncbi:MAG: S8 family serine peptidase [Halanaerobiaceae bacterium]
MNKKKLYILIILFLLFSFLNIKKTMAFDDMKTRNVNTEKDRNTNNYRLSDYKYTSYYVKTGDYLYNIALKYGTSIDSIMSINNLDSYMIYPGQKLLIAVPDDEQNNIYIVKSRDTFYRISQKYNISIDAIRSANGIQDNTLYIGQKLIIPLEKNNKEDNISYKSISGKAIINRETWSKDIIRQDVNLENKVFPMYEGGDKESHKEREIIVKYKSVINTQSLNQLEKENNLVTINSINHPEGMVVKYEIPEDRIIDDIVKEYREKNDVEWVEPNYIYYPTAIPDDHYYSNYQWNMRNMNMEAAWDKSTGNESVTVAVIDTGIAANHPDLQGNLLQGADFVGGVKSYPIDSYNPTDYDPTDETPYHQGGSHGTHVAGIIGAIGNNDNGVAGVSWQLKILPIRGLTKTGGTSWDIVESIYYAIDQEVDIINMSFGGNHKSYYQHEAIKKALKEGITVIAATGNEGSQVYYPAAHPETIAVGAVGQNNQKTAYSNYGPEVDLVAPGGNYGESIISTWGYYQDGEIKPEYTGMIGTSMAAPHVSGIAALLFSKGITDPQEIKDHLINNAIDLGEPGKDDNYGHGIVDAFGALINKKVENPTIFAARKEGDVLYIRSKMIKASDQGTFKLDVKSDTSHIIAWFDGNNNKIIDGGDYFGEVEYDDSDNIEINLFYHTVNSDYLNYQIKE